MGYRCHHAIIVTGTYEDWVDKAHEQASKIFKQVSSIIPSFEREQCRSFFVAPDGAEHINETREGDKRREQFIQWLKSQKHKDGSSPLKWVEVQYGDTSPEQPMVCKHSE
jgi:hypothetical protein